MSREKEIEQAMKDSVAETIYASGWGITLQATDLLECAFTKGAKWADEHPNLYNDEKYHTVKVSDLDRLYKKLELYEKYFDIACAWLEGRDYEFEYLYSEDGYTFFNTEKFINDFRKAMEE